MKPISTLLCILTGFILGIIYSTLTLVTTKTPSNTPPIPMDPFPEPQWRTPSTLKITTITSTAFARFEIHQVKTENGEIINDWLWTDERSHVNILVHLKDEDKYLLFYQKKYGLEKPYLGTQ